MIVKITTSLKVLDVIHIPRNNIEDEPGKKKKYPSVKKKKKTVNVTIPETPKGITVVTYPHTRLNSKRRKHVKEDKDTRSNGRVLLILRNLQT